MVYQWGRVGVITDEHCPAFQDAIKELFASREAQIVAELENAKKEKKRTLEQHFILENLKTNGVDLEDGFDCAMDSAISIVKGNK